MCCPAVSTTEDALSARLITSATQALELLSIHLGTVLGLYRVLADTTPRTPGDLAREAAIAPRYAREWLEQQAAAGLLRAEPTADDEARRYWLPPEHVGVLVAPEHPAHVAPLAQMVAGIGGVLDAVAAAYRSGGGVPYAAYGRDFRHGQGGINRPAFAADLVDHWIPALPDVAARLIEGGRVADVGCGSGWSTIAAARAFPGSRVVGIDLDAASIDDARGHAAAAGVPARFEVADAAGLAAHGPLDLVLLLEVLHDMSQPVDVLRSARAALAPGGAVLIADEKVAEQFHAPAAELERLMYGWSVLHCLPVSLADTPSAGIGTVMRPATVRELARDAGFTRATVLPIDGGFFRLYRLDP